MVSINGTGNTATSMISETGYAGTFNVSSTTCGSGGMPQSGQPANGPIATFSPMTSIGNNATITVTADEAGTCAVTFKDSTNQTVTLTIQITTEAVVVNKHGAAPKNPATNTLPIATPQPRAGAAPTPRSGH